MPFASVNGIDVHYRLAGDGPETIVLVNGLADDLETWAYQEADLTAAGYRVITVDMGRSVSHIDRDHGNPGAGQWESRVTWWPLEPTRKSRSAPWSACRTWSM
jgi:pimeloyl-ACP methyl ester carboxylesterase